MPSSSEKMSRRQFIRITASAGVLLAGGMGMAGLLGNTTKPNPIQETRLLMGSVANLTVISPDETLARAAVRDAFNRMSYLESLFSRYQQHSQVSVLNTSGQIEDVHPALREVLRRSVDYSELTGGAFDITVEPLCRLYRDCVQAGRLPDMAEIEAARQLVDYRKIEFIGTGVFFAASGMAITLDGIGKGYIIDQGAAVLREYGFENLLVEVGGDLYTLGKSEERPWQVSIRRPDGTNTPSTVAQLTNTSLATSGDYLNTFTPDRRLHHILNPASGVSPDELSSVSVIAPSVCDADAMATALMVMGRDRGFALINPLEGFEALVITKDGAVYRTPHFPGKMIG